VFCPRHHLRRPLLAAKQVKFSTSLHMLPPWMAYPYGRYEMGWRMGGGEDYWVLFWKSFCALSVKERKWYVQDFPEPAGWEHVYEYMIASDDEKDDKDDCDGHGDSDVNAMDH
jgi:hypothetical protein